MKKFNKRAGCLLLSFMLTLSLAACGKSEVIVDDYGSDGVENSVAEDSASDGDADSLKVVQGGQPLRDVYGDRISWEESIAAGGKTFNINASYTIPDVPGINVYRSRLVGDGKAEEEQIVKTLFGDTGKKIDEIKITNETDYITMAYKYKKLMRNRNMYVAYSEDEDDSVTPRDFSEQYRLISPGSEETYKWIDEDEIFIHMYEGDYQGIKYGLILAYDIYSNQRTIFFDPISIKAYYPDKEYKSLYIEGSNDSTSEPIEIENACSKSVDQVKEEASKFLKDKLNISSSINKITTDSMTYNYLGDNIAGYEFSSYEYKDEGASILSFTDSDYLSAIISGGHGGKGVGYQVLALQQDLFTESEETDIYSFITKNKYGDEASKEEVNFDVDGYAVYLESSIHSLNQDLKDPQNITFSFSISNIGRIKVTSKGIYGVDLTLYEEPLDIEENVKLLKFDQIKDCFREQIGSKESIYSVFEGTDKLSINSMQLTYYPYTADRESEEFSYIPAWEFLVFANNTYGVVYINAMDGTMLEPENMR